MGRDIQYQAKIYKVENGWIVEYWNSGDKALVYPSLKDALKKVEEIVK